MDSKFNSVLDSKIEQYFPQEPKTSKTEKMIETVMEGSFYDWASKYRKDAESGSGVVSTNTVGNFIKGAKDAYSNQTMVKWNKRIDDQWEGMHPGQRAIYSDPPKKFENHPIYKSLIPNTYNGQFDQKSVEKKMIKQIAKKRKKGEKHTNEDINALEGKDRFTAIQWNKSITREAGFGGGPGSEQWENRIKSTWDAMGTPKPSFDEFRAIKVNEYEATHN